MNTIIEINDVCKKFKDHEVLKNVNLKIPRNQITGFIGRNGSGKTVLLKIIAGLLKPSLGNVVIDGETIGIDTDFPKNVGILFEYDFLPNLTAHENLRIIANIDKELDDYDLFKALETVGLRTESKKRYRHFSTGMKQKLRIAQAIMGNPQLLILDEPFNGLDVESVKQVRELLLSLKQAGKTIVLTSHYKEDIDFLCNQVFLIKDGEISMNNGDVNLEKPH